MNYKLRSSFLFSYLNCNIFFRLLQTFQQFNQPGAFQQSQFQTFQQQFGSPVQTNQQLTQSSPPLSNSLEQTFSSSNDINQSPPPVPGDLETIAASSLKTPSLTTFVEALRAADLLETFNGADRFTVFAPDNEAFEKLPVGTLDNLLRPENRKDLRRLLRRHVISGWVLNAFSIPEGTSEVLSFGTEPINLIKTNGQISIQSSEGTSNVLFADGLATNGVVHMVDTVF